MLLIAQYCATLDEEENDEEPKRWVRRKERVLDWWQTTWGRLIRCPDVNNTSTYNGKIFRKRFRLPHRLFDYLVQHCKADKVFGDDVDAVGRPSVPVEIKVLGALRTLGRGSLHDDVAEISGADAESHRVWFLKFIEYVATRFKEEFISLPDGEEFTRMSDMYERMGFPNCVGSMDATHIHWMSCPEFAKNDHVGKEGFPTIAFNVVVIHTGRIIHVTPGFPGARNDKTIVRMDNFANQMCAGTLYGDLEATLHKTDGSRTSMTGSTS